MGLIKVSGPDGYTSCDKKDCTHYHTGTTPQMYDPRCGPCPHFNGNTYTPKNTGNTYERR